MGFIGVDFLWLDALPVTNHDLFLSKAIFPLGQMCFQGKHEVKQDTAGMKVAGVYNYYMMSRQGEKHTNVFISFHGQK